MLNSFKFTCWNIEHADKVWSAQSSSNEDKKRKAEARLDAITEESSAECTMMVFP